MKYKTIDELENKYLGEIGTPHRDHFEKMVAEELKSYYVAEAARKAREAQNLTQEELGRRIGVQKAQISRLEKGRTFPSIPTLRRVFTALGVSTATLDLGHLGKFSLW